MLRLSHNELDPYDPYIQENQSLHFRVPNAVKFPTILTYALPWS